VPLKKVEDPTKKGSSVQRGNNGIMLLSFPTSPLDAVNHCEKRNVGTKTSCKPEESKYSKVRNESGPNNKKKTCTLHDE
jgi:hypothetical protein